MKKQDIVFLLIIVLIFLPFFVSDSIYQIYREFNSEHGFIASFVKFAVLASYGEVLGLRIRTGNYGLNGFGLIPRIVVWGFLGIAIKAAFILFSAGGPALLDYLGMENPSDILAGKITWSKIFVAFSVSLTLNLIFSPVLMTFHRITDAHIVYHKGDISCLVRPIEFRKILTGLDWKTHWGFVLKKTIPMFWIPAHTITFLLPVDFQILFAAILGVILGMILAFAAAGKSDL